MKTTIAGNPIIATKTVQSKTFYLVENVYSNETSHFVYMGGILLNHTNGTLEQAYQFFEKVFARKIANLINCKIAV
ncbi:MAG: hypothetical protein FWD76_01865 [Firmicutes bacterium]|nr:hypothetical protein [Bacillota bacterium]